MQRPSPVVPARQALGIFLDTLMAPQPLGLSGPMAQGRVTITKIRNVVLILSHAQRMNMHEVPFHYASLANKTTKGLQSVSITFGKNPICQHTTNLSEFIAKQVPCGSGLYLKHEQNVKILLLDVKMMVSPILLINSSICCVNTTIAVNQSNSCEDRKIGKQFAPLWKELADQLQVLFPEGDDDGAFIIPALDARSQVLNINDRRNGVEKLVFKLASLGSGQTFTLVAPDLSVPGVSP